ncbi:flagellar motor control protein ZomB [Corynebacterium frankenforstense]|uniref:flagellar motor control protein ZomB n=1 Tax=Corynebacterium frankenforstense TaxID=1230998 RepID=UPI000951D614
MTAATATASGVLAAALMFWGGYVRRWMSDDGLIVLRTVRNLMAGNGPVFNAGERVETNTSVLWQYLIWAGAEVTDWRLERVATALALALTVLGVLFAALGAARMYRGAGAGRAGLVLVPAGLVVYLALPPARDFATSGLEWGLSLAWLGVLWWLLARWATRAGASARLVGVLACWAGLSWLVRPELALYGGVVGLLLLIAAANWRRVLLVLACGLPLPVAYQIFRMGYYGLLTPHTAVAKSASGSDWGSGLDYARDFIVAYQLWLPALVLIALGAWFAVRARGRREIADAASVPARGVRAAWARRAAARRPAVAVGVVLACAALHGAYVLRVGGDFMHGRMWLLPLFAALLPVAVVPVLDRDRPDRLGVLATGLACTGLAVWALVVVLAGHRWELPEADGELEIVDERAFWTTVSGREPGDPPRCAEDFLAIGSMQGFPGAVAEARSENDAQVMQITVDGGRGYDWVTVPRTDGADGTPRDLAGAPTTLYMLNLGMTSMNVPLDVRVLDTVGLATPLAARQPEIPEGRVGHDKYLPAEWQLADGGADLEILPHFVDADETRAARAALRDAEIAELLASYREPMSAQRFRANVRFALTGGRTLQLDPDPRTYLDVGSDAAAGLPDAAAGERPRVAWPVEVHTDGDPMAARWAR